MNVAEPPPSLAPEVGITSHRTPWSFIAGVGLVAALDAVLRLGRLHPDEVYQFLEPALFRAFGFGVVAWEWEVGLRNHAVPWLFAALLKGASAMGVNDPLARRLVLEVPQLALHLAMLGAVYRLTVRRVGALPARIAVGLVGLFPLVVWFGGRTMSESFSTAFLVWALERLDLRDSKGEAPLAGGVLLGLAQVTRYGSAAAIIPIMLWLVLCRRWRDWAWAMLGGLVVAVALGALDRVTWGGWWHSMVSYVRFNVLTEQASAAFGALPWYGYAKDLFVAPWVLLGLGLWATRRAARLWSVLIAALGYLALVSAVPHKEPRFIYPSLVLLAVAAAPAFSQWVADFAKSGGARRAGAVGLAVASTVVFYLVPTPFDVQRPAQFRFTVRAGREATGLVVMNEGVWGAGGFFYLGKNIPWFPAAGPCDFPENHCFAVAASDQRFNRAIYWDDPNAPDRNQRTLEAFRSIGFREIDRSGPAHYFARGP